MLLNGWPAFMCALAFITVISCFLIKLANSFGCVTGKYFKKGALSLIFLSTCSLDEILSVGYAEVFNNNE